MQITPSSGGWKKHCGIRGAREDYFLHQGLCRDNNVKSISSKDRVKSGLILTNFLEKAAQQLSWVLTEEVRHLKRRCNGVRAYSHITGLLGEHRKCSGKTSVKQNCLLFLSAHKDIFFSLHSRIGSIWGEGTT